jgi:hypothetical protein
MKKKNDFDIEEILKRKVTNIKCIERNEINIDIAAKAFYTFLKGE